MFLFRCGIVVVLTLAMVLSGCSSVKEEEIKSQERLKVGVMLSDEGLGDQSYNDAAFAGLLRARDELNIELDYRDLSDGLTYEEALQELVEGHNRLILALGFAIKESLEKIALENPTTQFLLIDESSDLPNIASLTFKEDEGSFLVGVIAGLKTQTNKVGFIGGVDAPVIHKFAQGYIEGIKAANAEAEVFVEYAGDFNDPKLGGEIARKMDAESNTDIIFAAAGLTGVGVLQEQQKLGKLAIGVDSDQFFIAEKAIITSMVKNVDTSIYSAIETYVQQAAFPDNHMIFGLQQNGVGMTSLHNISLTPEEDEIVEELKQKVLEGTIKIPNGRP